MRRREERPMMPPLGERIFSFLLTGGPRLGRKLAEDK